MCVYLYIYIDIYIAQCIIIAKCDPIQLKDASSEIKLGQINILIITGVRRQGFGSVRKALGAIWTIKTLYRGYPAKRALFAMRKHDG